MGGRRSQLPVLKLVNEDVRELTSGARTRAEEVGYKYAEIEKNHRFRFLFDPNRVLLDQPFIARYMAGENPFPSSAEIDPSNACNHNCGFCIYHSLHQSGRKEMLEPETLYRIIDELADLGCKSLLFVGGGEPLVHPNTVDGIERASSRGMAVGLVTNGSLLGKYTDRLRSAATYVRISFDASTRATHSRLHERDDFDQIVSNLKALAKDRDLRAATVGTGFFINEGNYHEIVSNATLVKSCGADYVQFKTYSGIPLDSAWHSAVLDQIEIALDLNDITFDVHVMKRVLQTDPYQVRGYSKCHWQAFKTVINADGSVYLCAQKRTDPTGRIGNVYNTSLREIWESEERKAKIAGLNLLQCPWCVHDHQNSLLEFASSFQNPHRGFI